jgi:uracil-DNA glycosylase
MNAGHRLRAQYLSAMGITVWRRRTPPADAARAAVAEPSEAPVAIEAPVVPLPSAQPPPLSAGNDVAALDWEPLAEAVRHCTRCQLHAGRTQTVFGVGHRSAQWMFVGEAPGADEDRQGEPFVGRAGQLLNAMIAALGLKREEVFIANVLKCRPPNNRDPQPDEVEQCEPYLVRQIELLRPGVIVALGRHAAHSLLKTELALGKLRGQRLSYHGIPLVVTYHPAYLLRNPIDKRKVWDDLRRARAVLEAAP